MMFLALKAASFVMLLLTVFPIHLACAEELKNGPEDSNISAIGPGDAARVIHYQGSLVAYWKFDDNYGTNALDSSGNENTAILNSFNPDTSSWQTGRIGGGLKVNTQGEDKNVIIVRDRADLNFTNGKAFSLVVWVRSIGPQSGSAGIITKGAGSGGEQFALDVLDNKFRFFVRPTTTNPVCTVMTQVMPTGRWQHLAATYDPGRQISFYINGKLVGFNRSAPGSLLRTSHDISIGSRETKEGSPYNLPFRGVIDDVRIYGTALSATEVQAIYSEAGILEPIIYTTPQNSTFHVGENTILVAIGDGTGPLSYQWQKDGMNILGATNSYFGLSDLRSADSGKYLVHVRDRYGARAGPIAELHVHPFFWQTWWFRTLVSLGIVLMVGCVVHFVERRKAKRALDRLERVHAIDRERMRIARDMHDEIGGKLSRISFLSDMARRSVPEGSEAGRQIDEVSEAARAVIQTVDEIVWAVNPRNDTLESLVHYICRHAEEFFELTPVELELELPEKFPVQQLSAEVRHSLFCAVKEALNNVLKHAAASKVRISFSASQALFRISVADNGRGFQTLANGSSTKGEEISKLTRSGNGLLNMRERLESMKGRCDVKTEREQGTTVVFSMTFDEGTVRS